ncbi:MAG: methionine aminotransferase [Bacteroidota bacterium]
MDYDERMEIASKLPQVGTTIFTVMSQMANEAGAINLSQGFPGYELDGELRNLVDKYIQLGQNQYAPLAGVPELLEAIANKKKLLYGCELDPQEEITITHGATEGIFSGLTTLIRPGDEVIYFEPAYDAYLPAIQLNGGVGVPIRLGSPDYRIDWSRVRQAMSPKTRLIIINSPHNPSGSVWTKSDVNELRELVDGTDILILSDEVYQHVIFDGLRHESVLSYPDLRSRALVTMSFGKTFHATGWRVGYTIAPVELTKELRKVHQFNTFSINRPFQYALAEYLQRPERYQKLPEFFQQKRDVFRAAIADSPFELLDCSGTYFQSVSYCQFSDKSDMDMAEWLTKEIGVASIPVSAFYSNDTDEHVLRFCFAKEDSVLMEAGKRLSAL